MNGNRASRPGIWTILIVLALGVLLWFWKETHARSLLQTVQKENAGLRDELTAKDATIADLQARVERRQLGKSNPNAPAPPVSESCNVGLLRIPSCRSESGAERLLLTRIFHRAALVCRRKRQPHVMSINLRKPRPMLPAPGSPSAFLARYPPKLATNRLASFRVRMGTWLQPDFFLL